MRVHTVLGLSVIGFILVGMGHAPTAEAASCETRVDRSELGFGYHLRETDTCIATVGRVSAAPACAAPFMPGTWEEAALPLSEAGEIEFQVPIGRYVGPVDPTGRLLLPEEAAATLTGWISTYPGFTPAGSSCPKAFVPHEFRVVLDTTEDLRFPLRGPAPGARPEPRVVSISLDPAELGVSQPECFNACFVPALLSFEAYSPTILVHGNASSPAFWNQNDFNVGFAAENLPFDGCAEAAGSGCSDELQLSIEGKGDSIRNNALELKAKLPPIVTNFGADSFHVVAHSKGGLDTREFLALHFPETTLITRFWKWATASASFSFSRAFPNAPSSLLGALTDDAVPLHILSLTTLSTPHDGSVLANITSLADVNAAEALHVVADPELPIALQLFIESADKNDGHANLTTDFLEGFNRRNLELLPEIDYNLVGADADRNASFTIDTEAEIATLREDLPYNLGLLPLAVAAPFVDDSYQILRNFAEIRAEDRPTTLEGGIQVNIMRYIEAIPAIHPRPNDVLVTVPSAWGAMGGMMFRPGARIYYLRGAEGRNHSDVGDAGVAALVAEWIRQAEVRRPGGDR